jgi:hypothetical protein
MNKQSAKIVLYEERFGVLVHDRKQIMQQKIGFAAVGCDMCVMELWIHGFCHDR